MTFNLRRFSNRCVCLPALLLAAALNSASVQAAEFVIAPNGDKVPASRDSASSAREKARVKRGEDGPAVPLTTIINELDEESPFGARPGSATTDTRSRARSYQQGGDGSTTTLEKLTTDPDSNRGKVNSNLDRARAYQKGDSAGVTNPRMGGTESLPIVDCASVENVAGRIGDDYASGSVIILMRDGKGVKVRCK